jgi:hypothetical protein
LRVNVKADFGKLLAEVQDELGQPIAGYTLDDCLPMHVDAVAHPVVWKEAKSLAACRDRTIRLRFHIENARLYSFRIV